MPTIRIEIGSPPAHTVQRLLCGCLGFELGAANGSVCVNVPEQNLGAAQFSGYIITTSFGQYNVP